MDKEERGVYILVLQLARARKIKVGKLGVFEFPAGFYLYVGSAMSGFAGRINRHLKKNKKRRWHIDYLLEEADFLWVDLFKTDSDEAECRLSRQVADIPGARTAAPGFGSSDCSCRTHLYHFKEIPAVKFEL